MTQLLKEVDNDLGEDFQFFCHELFRRNCNERLTSNEVVLDYTTYVTKNLNFLKEEFKARS